MAMLHYRGTLGELNERSYCKGGHLNKSALFAERQREAVGREERQMRGAGRTESVFGYGSHENILTGSSNDANH